MMYSVKLFEAKKADRIEANSDLEARLKYCQARGLIYRVFANKLEVKEIKPRATARQS